MCATVTSSCDTIRLASYHNPRNADELLEKMEIWEAARATSAASSFFDPITVGTGQTFVDGATGANNPIREVWKEAKDIWSAVSLEESIKCLVSIGTGTPSLTSFGDKLWSIGKSLKSIATDTENTAEDFAQDKSELYEQGRYYRFNVIQGLDNIGLEDSKQKGEILEATNRYVKSQDVYSRMRKCANNLVGRSSKLTY